MKGGMYYLPVNTNANGKIVQGNIPMENTMPVPTNQKLNISPNETVYSTDSGKFSSLSELTKGKKYTIYADRQGDVAVSKLKSEKGNILDNIKRKFTGGETSYTYSEKYHPMLQSTLVKLKDKSKVQYQNMTHAIIEMTEGDGKTIEKISVLMPSNIIQQTKKQKIYSNTGEDDGFSNFVE